MAIPRKAAAPSSHESTLGESLDWVGAHEALSRLARERAVLDAEEGHRLLRALRSGAHAHLGFGSFCEYVERLFGYKPRTTQEKLRVAEALECLPRLAAALASGTLGWCATRELSRVAVAETEEAWLAAARGKTQRELEALVAARSRGDAPDGPATGGPRRHVLRFEVSADTFATFRQAMQHLERAAGGRLDHDALLLAMARHALGGPSDDGRSSYQISLHVCSACKRGEQAAAGAFVPVDGAVVDMAACDAQHLGEVQAPAFAQRAANENADSPDHGSPPLAAAASEGDDPCSNHAHVSAALHRASDGPVEMPAAVAARPLPRARQNIPPALRRAVLDRDQHCCQVPGCTHSLYVDVHHLERRADGGQNVLGNLLTLCSAHHRATHHGQLLIERSPDGGIGFRHPDGGRYGAPASPQRVDVHEKVFSALRHLGFRESEVKAVLAELRADLTLVDAPVERLLREALCRIKPRMR